MMNKKNLRHIVTAASFAVFIVWGLACASAPPPASKNLVIPKGIYSISEDYYAGKEIETVIFSDDIFSIDARAFQNNNITSITFPSMIEKSEQYHTFYVWDSAFENNQIINVSFPTIKIVGKQIRYGGTIIVFSKGFANNHITELSFPENIEEIELRDNAFANNRITELVFPENAKLILYPSAFVNNPITSLTLPKSITWYPYAFSDHQIANLILPSALISIPDGAFKNNKLTKLTIPGGISKIGESAFENNELIELELSNSLEIIEMNAFSGNNLTTVNIPKSIKVIEEGSFDPDVVLTGNIIKLTPVVKTVPLSRGNFSNIITDLKVFDKNVKIVTLRKTDRIPLGVHTISVSFDGYFGSGSSVVGSIRVTVENYPITYDFKEGFSYRIVGNVEFNNKEIQAAELSVLAFGKSALNNRSFHYTTASIKIEEIKRK